MTMATRLLLLLATACWLAGAQAAELRGQKFDDGVTLGGSALELNGLGLRSILFLKFYVAGLYVPRKETSAEALLAQTGPRRLMLKMLSEVGAGRMAKLFREGIEKNHDQAALAALSARIDRLTATIASIGTAAEGDSVAIDFVDGATRIAVNGRAVGEPIPGDDFYAAVLRIFIGEHPADDDLKQGLLGG
ncbi:MAG: chalcone isomerase family protein [Burkholderiales bacterium]|nr:MAG: chalcone isomerase family protein [Burkholderiales bacterium]